MRQDRPLCHTKEPYPIDWPTRVWSFPQKSVSMVEAIRRYVALVAVMVAGCITAPKVDNTPVATLDLNRYLGEWYEIAL